MRGLMKKWKITAAMLVLICLLTGCVTVKITVPSGKDTITGETVQTADKTLFSRMPKEFVFSSGAGGWESRIQLADDGSFTGYYYDYDLGETGDEHPNGSAWICEFSGKFSTPAQNSEFVWSTKLESLSQERKAGEVYYEDGFRYTISEPRGFENAEEFLIYLPGTPAEATYYGVYYGLKIVPEDQYSLFNINGECEFVARLNTDNSEHNDI